VVLFSNRLTLFLASPPIGTSFSDAEIVQPSSVHNETIYKRWELALKAVLSSFFISLVLLSEQKIENSPFQPCWEPSGVWPGSIHICLLPSQAAGSQPGLPACPIAEHFVAQGHMPRELSAL